METTVTISLEEFKEMERRLIYYEHQETEVNNYYKFFKWFRKKEGYKKLELCSLFKEFNKKQKDYKKHIRNYLI